jgi:hypothetical protein
MGANMRLEIIAYAAALLLAALCPAYAQMPAGAPIPVTPDNFTRAETDTYFVARVKQTGIGKLENRREPMPMDEQSVIRGNRDTLYTTGVFDLDAGPVTIALPNTDVPVDAFWSVSLYNAQGYFEKNSDNAYSLNSITAKKNADGSVAIQFGGCYGKIPNRLPVMKRWTVVDMKREWKAVFPDLAAAR